MYISVHEFRPLKSINIFLGPPPRQCFQNCRFKHFHLNVYTGLPPGEKTAFAVDGRTDGAGRSGETRPFVSFEIPREKRISRKRKKNEEQQQRR